MRSLLACAALRGGDAYVAMHMDIREVMTLTRAQAPAAARHPLARPLP
jgi:hypothetical protein